MAELLRSFRCNEVSFNRPGARIANQMFTEVSKNFCGLFDEVSDVLCENEGKRFSERQAYGLFVRALLQSDKNTPEFVLTEVPVSRTGGGSGRLDLLYKVRGQTFATELKVVHRGIKSCGEIDEKISKAWVGRRSRDGQAIGVVSQLESMDLNESFEQRLRAGRRRLDSKKFPILIVCYHRFHDSGLKVGVDPGRLEQVHARTVAQLESCGEYAPFLNDLYVLEEINERSHRQKGRSVTILGFGIFGGSKFFELL